MQNNSNFQSGIANNLKYDLPAGLVVFLIALPLCLGIALASNAPLFSGIISGIVGGIIISLLSGSHVSVSGPAAGLSVIVATSIESLGSFQVFLTAVVLSGILQIFFGVFKAGAIGNYVPNSVIKGMLAAIGIVIILKQIPHALGRDVNYLGDFDFFFSLDKKSNTLGEILNSIYSAKYEAVIIAVVSLLILLVWDSLIVKKFPLLKPIPSPLIVVIVGILINEFFRLYTGSHLSAADRHLVTLPVVNNLSDYWGHLAFPDWAALNGRETYIVAATIAVVGSIESLLSLEASDKLDPYRRISSTNKELIAQGVGNLICGLLGGLPVTSVIVRSSANVYAGSRTRMSAFFHGVLLFACVLLIPGLLNKIPLSSLAMILIVIGYKLTKFDIYQKIYRSGTNQFLPFIITVVAIVFTDLLSGIAIGTAVGIVFVILTNHHASLTLVQQDSYYLLRFNKDVSFIHKTSLKNNLSMIPANAYIILDATKAVYVDIDIYDVVADFIEAAEFKNITVELKNFESKALSYWRNKHHGKL